MRLSTNITASMQNERQILSNTPVTDRSKELLHRATGLIPALTQTLAKGPGQHVRGFAPAYAKRGKGCRVWDVDGNSYIDLTMGVGPVSLGYGHDVVDSAIAEQLADGITFSLMHPLEVEVAELIRDIVPYVESVRFSKTGCDVTSAAVRLARAYTGRNTVLCCGYHGWHDWYIGVTDRHSGVPASVRDLSYTFSYNDLDSIVSAIDDDIAAIIMEPMVFDAPTNGFLEEVRALCDARGILLIFDEMWTGFRLSLGGAQSYFGVRADLVCFSKAIANGMPLSVLAGRNDVMSLLESDVFFFTTFGGEALSLAAAKATLSYMRDNDVIATIHVQGALLRDGYNAITGELGAEFTRAHGHPCRSIITFDDSITDPLLAKSYMQQELLRLGILWGGFHNVCLAHDQEAVDQVLEGYRAVLPMVADAVQTNTLRDRLLGDTIEPVFRRTGSFNVKPKRNGVEA